MNDYKATNTTTADPGVNTNAEISNDDVISTLNGLIQTCRDGQNGFQDASSGVSPSDLKSLFSEFSLQRAQFVGDLQMLVQSLGGDPEDEGSFSGALHRGWINLKAAITGNDDAAVLNECERGEDVAKNAYKTALENPLPAHVFDTVQSQYTSVLAAHNRIKALRDSANATKTHTAKTGS